MAHRNILAERQRAVLFHLPSNETALLRHYTLVDDDIELPHHGAASRLCSIGDVLKSVTA